MSLSQDSDYQEMDWVFLMQDIRGYIRVFGAEQLLHDLHELFPTEYQKLVEAVPGHEVKLFNKRKAALLGG